MKPALAAETRVFIGYDSKRLVGKCVYLYSENPYVEYDFSCYPHLKDNLDALKDGLKSGLDIEFMELKRRLDEESTTP